MNLQAKKLELVQLILNAERPSLLKKVEEVLRKPESFDWWDEISKEEKEAIDRSLGEADRGETIPHEEVMKEVRDKYNI